MQNKPNFQDTQMNANSLATMNYKIFIPLAGYKNKPNQTQFKAKTNPISKMPKMNLNIYLTMNYKNLSRWRPKKTNPIQTQSKPILKRMNLNFCDTGYYDSKQKAVEKPPLVEFTIFRVSGHQEKIDLA